MAEWLLQVLYQLALTSLFLEWVGIHKRDQAQVEPKIQLKFIAVCTKHGPGPTTLCNTDFA